MLSTPCGDASFTKFPNNLFRRLTGTEALVYLAIRKHAWEPGRCFPATRRIADLAGVGVSTVQRTVRKLEHLGALRVEHRWADAEQKVPKSNLYLFPDLDGFDDGSTERGDLCPSELHFEGPLPTHDRRAPVISDKTVASRAPGGPPSLDRRLPPQMTAEEDITDRDSRNLDLREAAPPSAVASRALLSQFHARSTNDHLRGHGDSTDFESLRDQLKRLQASQAENQLSTASFATPQDLRPINGRREVSR